MLNAIKYLVNLIAKWTVKIVYICYITSYIRWKLCIDVFKYTNTLLDLIYTINCVRVFGKRFDKTEHNITVWHFVFLICHRIVLVLYVHAWNTRIVGNSVELPSDYFGRKPTDKRLINFDREIPTWILPSAGIIIYRERSVEK